MTDQTEPTGTAEQRPPSHKAVGRRFGDTEIARILETATELQRRAHELGDGPPRGLTLDELRQIASEAGIDPRFVDLAVSDVDAPLERQESALAGGPYAWRFHSEVDGEITDRDRSRILQVIRDLMGRKGDLDDVFGRMEWSGDDGLGPVIIGLSTEGGKTSIDLSSTRSSEVALIHMLGVPFGGFLGGIAMAALLGISGAAVLPVMAAAAGTSYLAARFGWRLRSASWERRLRRVMERITSIVQEVGEPPNGGEEA